MGIAEEARECIFGFFIGDYIQLYTTKYKKLFLYINNNSYICAMRLVE
jgi:hypothetical protein